MSKQATVIIFFLLLLAPAVRAAQDERTLSGTIITARGERVAGVSILVRTPAGERRAESDEAGNFSLRVPRETLSLRFFGKKIALVSKTITAEEPSENLAIRVAYVVPPIHESVLIEATALDPSIERRNETVYDHTLFARDDQLFQTLSAGINAGQHEGGGKSLEVRRFGFNLDHGGVGGGLKVLVDAVQQNQATQGHGQGYLGSLKSLTPELVQSVDILNGPFSAQYGDFSGLGVVHIRQKETLPDVLTARLQVGSFNTRRAFLAYSPRLRSAAALVAYEGSRSDGPFERPLAYTRDNLNGNYTRRLSDKRAVGVKFNAGRNDFFSSGQIPLDEVAAGRLSRFGFLDPDGGGRVRSGVVSVYFRDERASSATLKADAFVSRSLFDLYSNFTFFLADEVNGDEIQQHDSRLQEGANVQYLRPYKLFNQLSLVTLGANYHDNRINVGLYPTVARNPIAVGARVSANVTTRLLTDARARVTNSSGYVQNGIDLWHGHLHVETGLRFDYFRFDVRDRVAPELSGTEHAALVQPKFNVAYSPADNFPATFYFNYGRGISSQDARGVVRNPAAPKVSTTDFYQLGTSHRFFKRLSLVTDLFLIDRSNEQVYIPDDGSFEFRGASRSSGFEFKTSAQLTKQLSFSGGLTRVSNAFYRGTRPRLYVDGAPHAVANAALTFASEGGFNAALGYRHADGYRLDGEDARLRAAGLDVLDFSMSKRLGRWLDFNLAVDNLTNKRYYETQNYFESRLRPGDPAAMRIHGTPGYPFGVTAGLTFRFFGKD
ncbi:MAG TPA: TonB-dependent receptor [Pyrinomonadaceae bacterium]|jgi:outer membrane receptor protein involved in Fe transport